MPISSLLPSFLSSFSQNLKLHIPIPNINTRLLTTTTITTALALLLPRIYKNYLTYLSYGPGGIPYNAFGWFIASAVLAPFSREMISTGVYERHVAEELEAKSVKGASSSSPVTAASYLDEEAVVARKRERPCMGPHVAPQRQLDGFAGRVVMEKLAVEFDALVSRNPHLLKLAKSNLEAHAEAIFVADGVKKSPLAQRMRGEIAHIHRLKDGSLHVVLSPADCKKVIENGWGQRHALSGIWVPQALMSKVIAIPAEYLFIYAPRTEDEIAFVMDVVRASVKFMTESEELL